ncbi:MAG: alpha/beta hydrolase [Pseudonocardiaceae bacterium]
MSVGRVLATQQARDAAKQLRALTGPVKEQLRRVLQHGGILADPQHWDSSLAGKWRHDWGHDVNQLNRTVAKLEELEHTARQVVEDIFKADNARFEASATSGLSAPGPPKGGTPADNAGWWASLSDQERQALLDRDPGALGNLDGLPAAVRDKANRSRIDDERAALEAERNRLQADLDDNLFGGLFTNADAALEHVNAKLASLGAIEKTLGQPGERQLLLLDLTGERAEAAVAVGDIDTADNVTVFTPGLGSTVDGSLEGYDDNMERLQRQAQYESNRYGEGGSVATVTWIGYQAPQPGFEGFNPFDSDSVLQDDSARAGGADLADFYRGINASRSSDPHLTALGHSYGSTTTGFALQQDTGVDDAVFFGSPGLGTSHIENLRVPGGHTYRVEARNDPVADFGAFGIDPSHMDGLAGLSAREETLPDGRRLAESTGHSDYLTQNSASQYNMSVVVAGLHDRIVTDDGRGLGDIGSWPIPGTY